MSVLWESSSNDRKTPRFDEKTFNTLFDCTAATHNELWRTILPSEAAFVRRAVIRAQEIRESSLDAGDAFLQGIAITLAADRPPLTSDLTQPAINRPDLGLLISGDPDAVVSVS
jgi:hypothetical protein